jgi:hypothetical protein
MTEEEVMNVRLHLAWQPIFGGGCRGLDYFNVLRLSLPEVQYILEWTDRRYTSEASSFSRRGRK